MDNLAMEKEGIEESSLVSRPRNKFQAYTYLYIFVSELSKIFSVALGIYETVGVGMLSVGLYALMTGSVGHADRIVAIVILPVIFGIYLTSFLAFGKLRLRSIELLGIWNVEHIQRPKRGPGWKLDGKVLGCLRATELTVKNKAYAFDMIRPLTFFDTIIDKTILLLTL